MVKGNQQRTMKTLWGLWEVGVGGLFLSLVLKRQGEKPDVDVGEATGWGRCFWQKKLSTY